MVNYKKVTNLLFELGFAYNVKNTSWQLIKADNIPSLAEHSYRCAIIAFVIAVLEKMKDPYKIAFKALINKTYKIRLCDRHKVSANYFDYPRDIEDEVRKDQFKLLGDKFTKNIIELDNLSNKEKVIIKDADQIELALEAREFIDKGYKDAYIWIKRIQKVLKTKSAIGILRNIQRVHSNDWWKDLKKKPQTKLQDYISRI